MKRFFSNNSSKRILHALAGVGSLAALWVAAGAPFGGGF
jgi:hypothetical protein